MSFSTAARIPPGAIKVTSVCARAALETLSRIATATTEKRIRLMALLPDVGRLFNSGDRRESPAGIVALIARAHNLGTPGESIFRKASANQIPAWNNQLYRPPVSRSD